MGCSGASLFCVIAVVLSFNPYPAQAQPTSLDALVVAKVDGRPILTCRVSSDQALLENGPFGVS